MKNLWSDRDARRMVADYAAQGVAEDLALRVYTTRLLGGEPRLVLHGGGNTSVKTRMTDVVGEETDVLCVKGSGWDMATIEPPGLPAVRLEPLRRLAGLESLSDEDMVNAQRCGLIDATAPTPSIETLLHAFLPHKYVDHTHANPVLALTDQPDGAAICAELYGGRAALVPYIMAGFALAKKAKQIYQAEPDCEGLILLKHGVFSFGATAREAYDRMIALVDLAERRLARGPRKSLAVAALPNDVADAAAVAPILRGLTAIPEDPAAGRYRRFVLAFRDAPEVMAHVNGAELGRYGTAGPPTPDHVIRTKPKPLIAPTPIKDRLDQFRAAVRDALDRYNDAYCAYFARNNARLGGVKKPLDPMPRVILVPGLGLFALAESAKSAAITADLVEGGIEVIGETEAVGTFESVTEAEVFDIEYWSLEQAKLGKDSEPPLARHVVVVTGAAGSIGRAIAAAFREAGAELALLDFEGEALSAAARTVGGLAVACDATDRASVRAAFDRVCAAYGGVDIAVSNAGAVWQGRIGEVDDADLRQSFELNFFAHQSVARNAVRVMRTQGVGGCLLFNASKQAVNPGPLMGPYGLAKAATLFLARQYAVDYGADGIRSNAVNADRVRSGLLTDAMIAARARARGVSEADYMAGNLLHREVKAEDVARAFVDLALAEKTTGAVLTVDGGNIAAALR
jgi:rhamnose utilization protein RhaD (predicted bifunctional aldolase and dehydrogenase)/NAD(P)-dependent dehydrogenase (short-subunit alcohol dehydrogenase family)